MLTDPNVAPTVLTLTVAQAAERAGVNEATIRRLIARPECPFTFVHIGRVIRISRESFSRWLRGEAA